MRIRLRTLALLFVPWVGLTPVEAPQPAASSNPFAGFETRILANGLMVWFKPAPGFRDVSVSVSVPYGSDQDPPGREQLAHFTEHMMFSNRVGRTEEVIKRALDERGGIRNAFTFWDKTFYFARVERTHGLFAIEWLHGIVSPREFIPEIIERQRIPVLIEVGARKRGLGEWLVATLIDPPALRTPDHWQREFGIETRRARDYYPWRSVHAITAADAQDFYDRYYSPAHMILTVIGDLQADSVWAAIDRTFATLPAKQSNVARTIARNPQRERRMYRWAFRSSVLYEDRYKSYHRTARDEVLLIFLSRWLDQRLDERLRFGQRKAVYGVSAFIQRRADAAQLVISGEVKREELAFARSVISAELERLASGTVTDSEFVTERAAITARLRAETNSAEALERWVWMAFFDRDRFADFPDLVGEFSRLDKREMVSLARRTLVPERRVVSLTYVIPLPQPLVIALGLVVLGIAVRIARWLFSRQLPMTRLRYVARIRRPIVWRLAGGLAYLAIVFVIVRLVIFAFQVVYDAALVGIDSFVVQWAMFALAGTSLVCLTIATGAVVPTKLLVFNHGVALKTRAYRSTFIAADSIADVAMKTLPDLVREFGPRALWTTRIMTLPIRTPAVFIRRVDGRGYLLRTRDSLELLEVLQEVARRSR